MMTVAFSRLSISPSFSSFTFDSGDEVLGFQIYLFLSSNGLGELIGQELGRRGNIDGIVQQTILTSSVYFLLAKIILKIPFLPKFKKLLLRASLCLTVLSI